MSYILIIEPCVDRYPVRVNVYRDKRKQHAEHYGTASHMTFIKCNGMCNKNQRKADRTVNLKNFKVIVHYGESAEYQQGANIKYLKDLIGKIFSPGEAYGGLQCKINRYAAADIHTHP